MSVIQPKLRKNNANFYKSLSGGAARLFTIASKQKQRFTALFFIIALLAPVGLQPAVSFAQDSQTNLKDLLTTQVGNPLEQVVSKDKLAADVSQDGVVATQGQIAEAAAPVAKAAKQVTPHELLNKRSARQTTYVNKDGSYTTRNFTSSHFYKNAANDWATIDTSLVEDTNAGDATNIVTKTFGLLESALSNTVNHYTVEKNDWQARFAPSGFDKGMLRIKQGGEQIAFLPVGANNVNPTVTTKDGKQTVHYTGLWKGVDVEYEVQADGVKENIIIKDKNALSSVSFKVVGATPKANKDGSFSLDGALSGKFGIAPPNLILNNFGYVESKGNYSLSYKNNQLTAAIDKAYLQGLPDKAFPVVLDPSAFRSTFGNRAGGNYISFKTDGTICYSNVCNLYAGSLYDANYSLQWWRGAFFAPYDQLRDTVNTRLLNANIHFTQRSASFWTGTWDAHNFQIGHATCLNGFNCVDGVWDTATFGGAGDINATNLYGNRVANGDFGAWIMVMGEDGSDSSFKNFDPEGTWVDFTYNHVPPIPTVATPGLDNQVFIDPQIGFQLNPVSDADGDALQYQFRVAESAGGTGTVITSPISTSTQWTIPDGMLQDGNTYYVQVQSFDGTNYSGWSTGRPFRVDMRSGNDKTQTYDTVGSASVDLATGNLSTSESSHTSSALAGSLGVAVNYNSPLRSRQGLVGEYWNVPANYGGGVPSGQANYVRVDKNVDFNWDSGSPSSGSISPDWFYARWTGYFVAPTTGSYTFGSSQDDNLEIYVNDQKVSGVGCCGGPTYNGSIPVNLTAGQVVPFRVHYMEATGAANARVFVKGAVPEQVLPQAWLQTGQRPTVQNHGLVGHYYNDDGTHNLDSATKTQFLGRTDPVVSFDWGLGSPIPNAPSDNFMVRWTGYFTAPTDGSYQFGAVADDGARLTVNGGSGNVATYTYWQDSAPHEGYSNAINLSANQTVPITVDYFEHVGGSTMSLKVQGAVPSQVIPTTWLSPKAQVLPDGWKLGIDPDGDLGYNELIANQSGVTLYDSTGDTHLYTWTGTGYKPPVNEDAHLVRNADGTYTLTDVDGRTYVFNTDGVLQSVTNPVDDRKPAALQYSYGGSPAKITKISDGVDPRRNVQMYYSNDGANKCGTAPTGFDAAPPAGMLCAVITSDGRATYFYYMQGNLARIVRPGNETNDYQYDQYGRIVSLRDEVANDALTAGVRADDSSLLTQISYDSIGRVSAVTLPAASAGAVREQKTYDYQPLSLASWTNAQPINGTTQAGNPSLVRWGTNKLGMFVRSSTNSVMFRSYEGGVWGDWQNLGGCIANDPGVTSWQDDRMDVFVQGCDNNIYTKYYVNGVWSDWIGLGGPITSSPSVTAWGPNRIDLVARGANNELVHKAYWNGVWYSLENQGGCISQAPGISTWGIDRLNIYVIGCGTTTNLFSKYWAPGWVDFSILTNETNLSSAPQTVSTSDKKIYVVARGANGDLRYLYYNGYTWEAWQTLASCIIGSPAITADGDTITIVYKDCNGNFDQITRMVTGSAMMHVTGDTEPKGYSDKIDYDNLFRTVRDYDKSGMMTTTEWNNVKDLQYSTTDAAGFKSTTLYDADDRPISSYGPAPAAWFSADNTPLSTYAAKIPRVDTGYDEGIVGPGVAWFSYKAKSDTSTVPGSGGSLLGAPRLHTTGLTTANPGTLSADLTAAPITTDTANGMTGIGFTATGKLKLGIGRYWVKADTSDGIRIWVDDQLVVDSWQDAAYRTVTGNSFTVNNTSMKRVRIDVYRRSSSTGVLNVWLKQDSGFDWTTNWSTYLIPDYGLTTSETTYDSTLGNTVSKTNFGTTPELGLAQSTTLDPTGVNLTSTAAYEAPGATGSYLRQTSKTLPGGVTTTYAYYAATETADNPCTTAVEAYPQGGMLKTKTEADPDGAGTLTGRSTQTVYDDSGRIVATRYNSDGWTCTTYDARGRVASVSIPAFNSQVARTVTNNYAVNGNPLIVSSTDAQGTITTQTDLSGRVASYTDAKGNVTTSTYDNGGHLTARSGPLGAETFTYDDYDRLVDQKLDGAVIAHINYDTFSRISSVTYPTAGAQKVAYNRDELGRLSGLTYTLGDGTTTVSDAVTLSQSGQVVSGTENGLNKAYTYDTSGRLISATLGSNTLAYDYSAPSATICKQAGVNLNAHLDSNRTKLTINGTATNYCYDGADRLIYSSDAKIGTPVYDTHGNITKFGSTTATNFVYDSSDRNIQITQGTNKVVYTRDSQGRLTNRKVTSGVKTTSYNYGYTGSGDTPDLMKDDAGLVQEKYMQLPGNVLLTIRPTQTTAEKKQTFSLPNIHGDVMATTSTSGALTGRYMTGPYGEVLTTSVTKVTGQTTTPGNVTASTFSYVGQNEKFTEDTFTLQPVQMGSRVYIPSLGRFTQVDPQEGGTPNSYVYPPDPVNDNDLSGQFGWKKFASIASWGSMIPGPIGMASAAVSAAAYAKAGDRKNAMIMAATVAAAAVGAGAAVKAYKIAKSASMASKASTAVKASNSVYHAKDAAGVVRYVGITSRNPATRFAEHIRSGAPKNTLSYYVVHSGLTRMQARKLEQFYINKWGLQKNGGRLINKINSIRRR